MNIFPSGENEISDSGEIGIKLQQFWQTGKWHWKICMQHGNHFMSASMWMTFTVVHAIHCRKKYKKCYYLTFLPMLYYETPVLYMKKITSRSYYQSFLFLFSHRWGYLLNVHGSKSGKVCGMYYIYIVIIYIYTCIFIVQPLLLFTKNYDQIIWNAEKHMWSDTRVEHFCVLVTVVYSWFNLTQGSHSSWKIIEIQICFKIMVNHWIWWKVLEICKNEKIMEKSLNFGSVAHGKIIGSWNRQFWLTTWVNEYVFYINIIYWYDSSNEVGRLCKFS